MKKLFLIFILFISCNSDYKKISLDSEKFFDYEEDYVYDKFIELNGDIERIIFTSYGVENKFNESIKFIKFSRRFYFEEGRLSSITETDVLNEFEYLETINYNNESLPVKRTGFYVRGDYELEQDWLNTYEYNSDGYLSKEIINESSGYIYEYNDKGLKIKETYYNIDYPKWNSLYIYEYDSRDKIKKINSNNISTEYTNIYDENYNLKEIRVYENGIQTGLKQREYDKNNNLIKEIIYNEDGKVSMNKTFKYENNRVLEFTDSGEYLYKFYYDEKGNISEIENYKIGEDSPRWIHEWVYIYE